MSSTISESAVKTGHPIGFWFFFWGEFAERCSYYGMRAILALYMTERLGVEKEDAGTFMSLFIAACYAFPLVGGWLADNFFGKYWTIVGFSVPYVVAQFIVGIENRYLVFGSLALLAMGSGVIKPNISTLMGLTYDQQRPGLNQLRTSAFSWFYMAINIGAALSQFTMPLLRTKFGYQVAFIFPAVLMAMALVIFALGKKFYAREKIEKKVPGNPGDPAPAEGRTVTGLPIEYRIVSPVQIEEERRLRWQTLNRIGAVFLTVMFFWAIFDQAASTWIFFADTYMETTIFGERADGSHAVVSGASLASMIGTKTYGMSADAIQFFNPVFIVLLVPVSVWIFKTLSKMGWTVKATQKMVLGYFLTGLSMAIMAYAGTLTGTKSDALKLTSKEGDLVLPKLETDLKDVPSENGKAVLAFSNGGVLTASDWAYDKDKKKGEFSNGEWRTPSGKVVTLSNGHMDFEKSRALVSGERTQFDGTLETSLKTGKYPLGNDTLVVDPWNATTIASGEKMPAVSDEKPPKISLEKVDWVKPGERVTVWWQIFAYLILTIAEILISVTGLELAFVAAPPTMKSFVTACWLAVVFLANLLINAPITRLYPKMKPDAYFAMLGCAMIVVIVVFIPIARRFNIQQAALASAATTKQDVAAAE